MVLLRGKNCLQSELSFLRIMVRLYRFHKMDEKNQGEKWSFYRLNTTETFLSPLVW